MKTLHIAMISAALVLGMGVAGDAVTRGYARDPLSLPSLTIRSGGTITLPEGALENSRIVSADVKDATLTGADMTTNTVAPSNLTTEAKKDAYFYQVEDLAAGADIATRAVFRISDACTVTRATVLSQGSPSGVDNSNTAVVTIANATGPVTLKTFTYNAVTAFPAANAADSSTGLSATAVAAGDIITVAVTNGAAADPPAFMVSFDCAKS